MNKIAVIYGGLSSEREVSIKTKDAICKALDKLDIPYISTELDKFTPKKLMAEGVDLVVNAMHGKYGEDGRLPALLDIMQIPYTHSGFQSSQIGMNKLIAKKFASDLDINTPNYAIIHNINDISNEALALIKSPFVLKPISEGSSIGVHVFTEIEGFEFKDEYFAYGPIMIEEYIKGQELNAVIIDNKTIGVVEVRPNGVFYDYDAKYNSSNTDYILSPNLSKYALNEVLKDGEKIHNYIGCNYVSRVEFMVKDDIAYFLEINTHPGFTETSLVPKVAKRNNMEFSDIVKGLINSATYID